MKLLIQLSLFSSLFFAFGCGEAKVAKKHASIAPSQGASTVPTVEPQPLPENNAPVTTDAPATPATPSSAEASAPAMPEPNEEPATPQPPQVKPNFDVNDVSILLPLPRNGAEFGQMTHLAMPTLSLISSANFNRLLNTAQPAQDPTFNLLNPAAWFVLGMRFDPCAKDDPAAQSCVYQLKLVAQPFQSNPQGFLTVADHAVHLIYQLSAQEGRDVAHELLRLKKLNPQVTTNGQPLAIHPVIRREGLGGIFNQNLRALIGKYAKEEKLVEATAMLTINQLNWRFAKTLMKNDQLEQAAIPFSPAPVQTMFGAPRNGTPNGFVNQIVPAATHADSLNQLVDSDPFGAFFRLNPIAQQAQVDAALRIENPMKHTPATIDCVSCHMASRGLARVRGAGFLSTQDGNPNRFPAPVGVTIRNATDVRELTGAYATRTFGYMTLPTGEILPVVAQRTINDTARVADLLNQNMPQ